MLICVNMRMPCINGNGVGKVTFIDATIANL